MLLKSILSKLQTLCVLMITSQTWWLLVSVQQLTNWAAFVPLNNTNNFYFWKYC